MTNLLFKETSNTRVIRLGKKYLLSKMSLLRWRRCDNLLRQVLIAAFYVFTILTMSATLNKSYKRSHSDQKDIQGTKESRKNGLTIDSNFRGRHLLDSCNSSMTQFTSLYSLDKFVGSGCESWAGLVRRKEKNLTGVIKFQHGLGCNRNKTKDVTILSMQEQLLKKSTDGDYFNQRSLRSLHAGVVLQGCPGVMQLQDVVCHGNAIVPIWQHCTGLSLKDFAVHNNSKSSIRTIQNISYGIAQTLICMIERGIWYIDLVSSNILYDDITQKTCIIDLESAKYMGSRILNPIVPEYTENILSTIWKDGSVRVKFLDPILTLALHVMHLMNYQNSSSENEFSPDQTTIHQMMNIMGKTAFDAYKTKYNIPVHLNENAIPRQRTPLDRLKKSMQNANMEHFIDNLLSYAYIDRVSSLMKIDRATICEDD